MDILFLRDFRVAMIIGIYEWERKAPQPVRFDLEIGLPGSRAGQTDEVADTIDYGAVAECIKGLVATHPFHLVESLAEEVARLVRVEYGAPWVRVSVAKLGIIRGVKEMGVVIERGVRQP
jgi:dihydroneopterin aldolase